MGAVSCTADLSRASEAGHVFIYFLRAGEFVKIGWSRNWKRRLADMQVGSPFTVVPLLVVVDEASLETRLHVRFKTDHFRGEWFHLGSAIRTYIKNNLSRCVARTGLTTIPKCKPREIIL